MFLCFKEHVKENENQHLSWCAQKNITLTPAARLTKVCKK
jgi:hypothetical protein